MHPSKKLKFSVAVAALLYFVKEKEETRIDKAVVQRKITIFSGGITAGY